MTKQELFLHWVNVAILARYHNPSILNPDFLVHNEVVSPDWQVKEVLNTPPLAQVIYTNGLTIAVTTDRLDVKETCDSEVRESYLAHSVAAKYIATLPHVRYIAVGLNWFVSVPQPNPGDWLQRRFLKSTNWLTGEPALQADSMKFTMEAKDSVCNLTLSAGTRVKSDGEKEDVIVVDCNFDHRDTLSAEQVGQITQTWKDKQNYLIGSLERLLGIGGT